MSIKKLLPAYPVLIFYFCTTVRTDTIKTFSTAVKTYNSLEKTKKIFTKFIEMFYTKIIVYGYISFVIPKDDDTFADFVASLTVHVYSLIDCLIYICYYEVSNKIVFLENAEI